MRRRAGEHQQNGRSGDKEVAGGSDSERRIDAEGNTGDQGNTRGENARSAVARSRVTKGAELLPGIDCRSPGVAGIATSSVRSSSTEVVGDYCSESRRQLIRRFAAAACFAEQLEARLVNGEQIDIQQHATLSSTLVAMSDAWNVPDAGDLARVGRLALVVEFLIQREGRKFETDRELPLNYSAFPVSRAISPSKILRIYRILSEAR